VQLGPSAMLSADSMHSFRSTSSPRTRNLPLSHWIRGTCGFSFLVKPGTKQSYCPHISSTRARSTSEQSISVGSSTIPSRFLLDPAPCQTSVPLLKLNRSSPRHRSSTTSPSTYKHWHQLHQDAPWRKL